MRAQRTHDPFASYGQTASGLYVPAVHAPKPRPIAVDLFAGAGGFSLGFHQAGWHVAAAVEFDTAACATYLCNLGDPQTVLWSGPGIDDSMQTGDVARDPHAWKPERCADVFEAAGTGWISGRGQPRDPAYVELDASDYVRELHKPIPADEPPLEHMFKGDVRYLTGQMILDALDLDEGDVDAVIGGPPCQGFSNSGKRDVMDPRNSLVFDFARIVCEIKPKTFVMENVTGITTMLTPEGVPVLDALALVFETGGMGTFEALRRSLWASSGNGAAIKGKPAKAARRAAEKGADKAPPEDGLW